MNGTDIRTATAVISTGPHRPDVTDRIDLQERAGQPVTLVCLDRSRHEHGDTLADVLHFPLLSLGVLSSLVIRMARQPGRIVRAALRLLAEVRAPRIAAATLLRLPAAVHLAKTLEQRSITVVQGADPLAGRMARLVSELYEGTPPDMTTLPVDWARLTPGAIGIRWYSRRINSIAAEVSLDDGRRVVVKRRQEPDALRSAVDRAAHERDALRSLAAAMHDDRLAVPEVFLFDEQSATLVMEAAPGTTIESLFAAAAADPALLGRLAAGIRGAGEWLAAMQSATRRTTGSAALVAGLIATARKDIAKVALGDSSVRRRQSEIVEGLEALAFRLSGRPMVAAGHHGDYFPGNVFFDGQRVTVIDLESFRDGLPLEDVAYFLIRADMLRRRFRLPFPDLEERFFEGYSPGQEPDAEALRLFTVTSGLRTLASGIGEDLPAPQRIWTRRTIRGAVFGALQDRA